MTIFPSWSPAATISPGALLFSDSDRIPGIHIPLAFLSSLRTNIQISFEDVNLATSSPNDISAFPSLIPEYATTIFGPVSSSVSPLAKESPIGPLEEQEEDLDLESSPHGHGSTPPTYGTLPATTANDRAAALRLVAKSVSEQRQLATRCIVLHPAVLTVAFFILGLGLRRAYYFPNLHRILPALALFTVLVTTCILLILHHATRGYLHHAEIVGSAAWLRQGKYRGRSNSNGNSSKNHLPPEDDVIIAKSSSGEVVGCLVLRIARTNALTQGHPSANGARAWRPQHRHNSSCSSYTSPTSAGRLTGIIRAWTVKREHRRQGAGHSLIEEAAAICRSRRLDGPIFADDHAHSQRFLPMIFNREFEARDQKAQRVLTDIIKGVTKN